MSLIDTMGEISQSEVPEIHQNWAIELKEKMGTVNDDNLSKFIEQEVGDKFTRVLEDAGVFKQTNDGLKGFKRFVNKL